MATFGNMARGVFFALLGAGALWVVLSSPAGVRQLSRAIGRELKRKAERERFMWTVGYLRRKKYLDYHRERDGRVRIELTEDGRKRALRYKLDALALPKAERWDGRWRIIAFDIPEEKRRGRDALRRKLLELGCVQLQKSLWVWPYECQDEIDFVSEMFDVGPHVHYVVAGSITSEKFLRHRFNLR